MNNNYSSDKKQTAYEIELDKLISQCEFYAFTYKENIQLNRDLNEGINDFLLQDRKNKLESELELSKIFLY
jgi:hypothetical protein